MAKKKIFIGWSGKLGKELAEGFKGTICDHSELDPFISSDIKIGSNWFREIENHLDQVEFGVGCMAPGASMKPWFNFEAGYLFGKLKNFKLVLFGGEQLVEPLSHIQAIDGTKKEDLVKLLTEMIGKSEAEKWIKRVYDEWKKIFEPLEDRMKFESKIESILRPVLDSASLLKNEKQVRENKCLQLIINQAIEELGGRINNIRTNQSFAVPATQWPYYLVRLKEDLAPNLKAVSLVDQQDTFWLQDIGREILRLSFKETDERIFVFVDDVGFDKHFENIQRHAAKYNVWVVTMKKLTLAFPAYTKDLGILDVDGKKLLAIYDKEQIQKQICFTTSLKDIARHEEVFERIKGIAEKVPASGDVAIKEIKENIFNELEGFDRREVEMSIYTSVLDYHLSAEQHAYYKEMTTRMIDILKEHRGETSEKCRILEFGAGTGIFTKHLVELDNVEVVALEIDWAYYNLALYSLPKSKYPNLKILNKDSRRHDPDGPEGKFKYILSSFSDHHIRFTDKKLYFHNVRNNLDDGGLFIVGDKFLRPHDSKNEEEHKAALSVFHNHIIEIAEKEAHTALVELEKDALQAKLKGDVYDFKLSCDEYEELLHKAGLRVKHKEKIGPSTIDDIGGVYVYAIELGSK